MNEDILRYVYFDKNEQNDAKRLETIIRFYCPKLSPEHPKRIEKLLNVLDLRDAIKLFMVLPKGTLKSTDLSSRSQIRPYLIDFVDDMREKPISKENGEILAFLLDKVSTSSGVADLESTLQLELERKIKFISERNKNSLGLIKRRF